MKIINAVKNTAMKNMHNVSASKIYDSKNAVAVHISLEAGESLKPHITSVDVFFYVLEGETVIEIGKEKETVRKDSLVESPAGIVHCIYNETDEKVRVLVVKIPRPEKETKLL
jgi:mannose-6-phosphate isomerase-like protein (cupin superfamily)